MLKKSFLLGLVAFFCVTISYAQNLYVDNQTCADIELDFTYAFPSTCAFAPVTGHAVLSPGFTTVGLISGLDIQAVNVIELNAPVWNYVQVWNPFCGPNVGPFPSAFVCSGAMQGANLDQISASDYLLTIF